MPFWYEVVGGGQQHPGIASPNSPDDAVFSLRVERRDPEGVKNRLIRGVPVGSREMWFEVAVPRVRCDRCGITRQVRIPFAEKKKYRKPKLKHLKQIAIDESDNCIAKPPPSWTRTSSRGLAGCC